MYVYVMAIVICELLGIGIDFININSLFFTQCLGILILALAFGLIAGAIVTAGA